MCRKKRGRLLGEEKNALHKRIFNVSQSIFNWYSEKYEFLGRKYFFNPKLLKDFRISFSLFSSFL